MWKTTAYLFYENRLGIKKSKISFVYLFCPNTGTKSVNPIIQTTWFPHRDIYLKMIAFETSKNIFKKCKRMTVLQIRRCSKDNYLNFSLKTYVVTPSLEPSHRDGSFEESQHMFSLRNKENFLWIFPVSSYCIIKPNWSINRAITVIILTVPILTVRQQHW